MSKIALAIAVIACLCPVPAWAVDHSGSWAVGFYDQNAPLGVRRQLGERTAVDFGVGVSAIDLGEDDATTWNVEAGVPFTLVKTARADLFLRPGFLWTSTQYAIFPAGTSDRVSDFTLKLHLGAEWHVTGHLSASIGHGIEVSRTHGTFFFEEEPSTNLVARAFDLTQIGFRWYFGAEE